VPDGFRNWNQGGDLWQRPVVRPLVAPSWQLNCSSALLLTRTVGGFMRGRHGAQTAGRIPA